MKPMMRGVLICSDGDCTAVYEAYGSLDQLAVLACDCGYGLELVGWPDPVEGDDEADGTLELIALAA